MTATHYAEADHLERAYDEAVKESLGLLLPIQHEGRMLGLAELRWQNLTGIAYEPGRYAYYGRREPDGSERPLGRGDIWWPGDRAVRAYDGQRWVEVTVP